MFDEFKQYLEDVYGLQEALGEVQVDRSNLYLYLNPADKDRSDPLSRATCVKINKGDVSKFKTVANTLTILIERFTKHLRITEPEARDLVMSVDFALPTFCKLYHITMALSNHDDTHRIVYTEPKNGSPAETFYFEYDQKRKGWLPAKPELPIFHSIIEGRDSVELDLGSVAIPQRLTILERTQGSDIDINNQTGEVILPTVADANRALHYNIVEQSDKKVVVDYFAVRVRSEDTPEVIPMVKMSANRHVCEHESKRHTFALSDTGVKHTLESIEMPSWMKAIRSKRDLIKNPTNSDAHPFLSPSDTPILDSEEVFIDSQSNVYVKVVEDMWVQTSLDWVLEKVDQYPSFARMLLALQLQA